MSESSNTRLSKSTNETWSIAIDYIVGRKRAEESLMLSTSISKILRDSSDVVLSLKQILELISGSFFEVSYLSVDCKNGIQAKLFKYANGLNSKKFISDFESFLGHIAPNDIFINSQTTEGNDCPLLFSERNDYSVGVNYGDSSILNKFNLKCAMLLPLVYKTQNLGYIVLANFGVVKTIPPKNSDILLFTDIASRISASLLLRKLLG